MMVYCRVVNKSRGGEPEQLVFQRQDNLERIEPETITKIWKNNEHIESDINDGIEYVLTNMGHYCYIHYHGDGYYRHTLILE